MVLPTSWVPSLFGSQCHRKIKVGPMVLPTSWVPSLFGSQCHRKIIFFSGYEDTFVFVIDYIAAGRSLRP